MRVEITEHELEREWRVGRSGKVQSDVTTLRYRHTAKHQLPSGLNLLSRLSLGPDARYSLMTIDSLRRTADSLKM